MLYIVPRNNFLHFKLMERTRNSVPLLGLRPVAHTSRTAQVAFTASIEASVWSDSLQPTLYFLRQRFWGATCYADTRIQKPT